MMFKKYILAKIICKWICIWCMHGIWETYLGQNYLQLPCCIWYLDINNFWKNI